MPNLEIFSQGEEIVTGQTVDSNAAWLSEQGVQLGFSVVRHTAVGDKLDDLIGLLKEIAERADCCLCTGGLGPTSDDLTAEAVAAAFGLPLEFDPIAFAQIEAFFHNRQRAMPAINRKQALLPQGAIRLDNDWGTAPGFAVQAGRCWFAFMPGVPSEMRNIFQAHVKTLLLRRFALQPAKLVTIKTFGIGESDIQQAIRDVAIPEAVQLGFRAGIDEVQTKLLFPHGCSKAEMAELADRIAGCLNRDTHVFGIDGLDEKVGGLASVVDRLMQRAGATLSVVETASHGAFAGKCLGFGWLHSAVYEKSLNVLAERLGVALDPSDAAQNGSALAEALWQRSRVDIVLVQTYEGGSEAFSDKNRTVALHTALVHHTRAEKSHVSRQTYQLSGPPQRKQNQAALFALNMLRRHLQNLD